MADTSEIQIITVYARGGSGGRTLSRGAMRWLSLLSLLVALAWLFQLTPRSEVVFGRKISIHSIHNIDWWIKNRLLTAGLSQMTEMSQGQKDPWVALGLARPKNAKTPERKKQADLQAEYGSHMRVLGILKTAWVAVAALAGFWLLLAALLGLIGRRIARRLHVQAAFLILLSTAATVAAIYSAVRWGGMPPIPNKLLYAQVAGVQSAYAWIILLATRFIR